MEEGAEGGSVVRVLVQNPGLLTSHAFQMS